MTNRTDFRLDAQDRIVSVGHDWDQFALENGAPELICYSIIGRPLLDFVTGQVTRSFVLALLSLARSTAQTIELDYRCDSAHERRFMRMRVSREASGALHLVHDTLRTEARTRAVLIAPARQRARYTPVRCSMCNRVKAQHDWLEPEQLTGSAPSEPVHLSVIYGICQACEGTLLELSNHPSP